MERSRKGIAVFQKKIDSQDMQKISTKHAAGYTLVEVLVSGMLLVFSVTAAVAVVGTGTQLGASDNERRQARAIIRSVFERSYDYRDFNTIPESGTMVEEVVINESQEVPLTGFLTRTVSSENIMTTSGTMCPVRRVNLSLRWTSPDGRTDSLTLTKLVTQ